MDIMLKEFDEVHRGYPEKPIIVLGFDADTITGLHSDLLWMLSGEY